MRAGGRVPLASLGKVLVEPVTAIIIVYAYLKYNIIISWFLLGVPFDMSRAGALPHC